MRKLSLGAAAAGLLALPLSAGGAVAGGCDCGRAVYGYGAAGYGYGAPVYAYPAGRTYGYAYAAPVYGYYAAPPVVVVAPPVYAAPAYGYYAAPAYGYAYEPRRRGFLGIDW
jgi:hypothetical protein